MQQPNPEKIDKLKKPLLRQNTFVKLVDFHRLLSRVVDGNSYDKKAEMNANSKTILIQVAADLASFILPKFCNGTIENTGFMDISSILYVHQKVYVFEWSGCSSLLSGL